MPYYKPDLDILKTPLFSHFWKNSFFEIQNIMRESRNRIELVSLAGGSKKGLRKGMDSFSPNIYLFKVNSRNTRKMCVWNMLKVNTEDKRMTSMTSFLCLSC